MITDNFQHILNNSGCDVDSAFSDWTELKLHVKNNPHFRVLHPLSLWQRISQEDVERNNYSNIMKVIHLTSVYPMANASCERGFSTMKRVKSDWRCTLGNDTMDMLMRVKIEGPKKQADYRLRAAVNTLYDPKIDRQRAHSQAVSGERKMKWHVIVECLYFYL